ncbi:MAG: ATP-binding protein [Rhodocyclaceae bacterium]|nr:ATP-binding protein [Rhodocyclaceae bacterium]MBK9623610.1 ATP-binding protein [Rhodocyclaceae bacterium]MBP6108959.1 ATP-binding protein [Rhodocyclaceae bacterium]
MINRPLFENRIRTALDRSPVVALVGPRQVGKTTLARQFVAPDSSNYFDLEDPISLARLAEPMTALAPLSGLVVIDEIQRAGDLFPVLRVLADRPQSHGEETRFLILGSASPALLQQSSESLAGRIEVIEIGGLALDEVGVSETDNLWLRGGFPRAFLSRSNADSQAWRKQFLLALVERDLPQLGMSLPPAAMMRFLAMLAHYHGQIWNAADPARSLGISEPTVRRYLDLLTGAYLVRQLAPWHENLGKRQVKSPKLYWRDSGLLHQLLGISTHGALLSHPRCGASWEGFVMEALLRTLSPDAAYFWATHTGAELDGLFIRNGFRLGIEIKRADAPRMTPSMRHALADLKLDLLWVIYPGNIAYSLHERVQVLPLAQAIAAR